jgi:molybdenum cofactor guanylyltransferase
MAQSTARTITLGILAGGQATRLHGRDKAWLPYRGTALIERTLRALGDGFELRMLSANRDVERYEKIGMMVVVDRVPGFPGPLAGIDAMLAACDTEFLLTVPVDLRTIPGDLAPRLLATGDKGAVAQDDRGVQPLVALWPVERASEEVGRALARGDTAVHRVAEALALSAVRFPGADFGNLNTADDFDA